MHYWSYIRERIGNAVVTVTQLHLCRRFVDIIVKVETEQSSSSAELPDEVLKVWDVESSHKYENNQHTSQVK